ncbi:hypothetical protein CEP51_013255 [Fusarium floridanum]|uniref:Uncharacterized protein n=1 Tax=Fusarium floridanum TaxID=1325733 RepID=A0A428QF16_9HYPO|nr:hypothetical protein CEP51_013255 [Fusarium floridanum]
MSSAAPVSFKAYQPYAPEGATSTSDTEPFPASLDFRRRSYITTSSSNTDLPTLRIQHDQSGHHAKQQPPKLHINTGSNSLAPSVSRPRAISWSPGMSPQDKAGHDALSFLNAHVSEFRERPRSGSELPKTITHKEPVQPTTQSTAVPLSLVPGFNTPPQSLVIGHGARERAHSTTSSTDGTREYKDETTLSDRQSILIAELEGEIGLPVSRPSSEKNFVAWPGPAPSSLGVTSSKDHRKSWSYYQSIPTDSTPEQNAYVPYSGATQASTMAASTKTFQPFKPAQSQIAHPPSMIPGLGGLDAGAFNQTNYRYSMPAGGIMSQSNNSMPSLLGLEGFEATSVSQHLPPERPTAPHRRVASFQKHTPPVSKPGTPESFPSSGHGSPFSRPVQAPEVEIEPPTAIEPEAHTNTNLTAPTRPKRPVSAPMAGLPMVLLPGYMQGAPTASAPRSGSVPATEQRAKVEDYEEENTKSEQTRNPAPAQQGSKVPGAAVLAAGGGLGYLVSSQLRRADTEDMQPTSTESRQQEVTAKTNWQPATVSGHSRHSSSQPMLPELDLSDLELDLEPSKASKGAPVPHNSKYSKSTRDADDETSDYEHDRDDSDDEDDVRPSRPNAVRLNTQDNTYSPARWENEEVDYEGSQYYRRVASWRSHAGK